MCFDIKLRPCFSLFVFSNEMFIYLFFRKSLIQGKQLQNDYIEQINGRLLILKSVSDSRHWFHRGLSVRDPAGLGKIGENIPKDSLKSFYKSSWRTFISCGIRRVTDSAAIH